MNCSNSDNWTVQLSIPETETENNWRFILAEYRPYELDLKLNRTKFNYCRAEFKPEVGQSIQQGIQNNPKDNTNGKYIFDSYLNANVIYDDEIIANLCFRTDWMELQNDKTVLELKDPHYAMKGGNITIRETNASLIDIYKEVVDAVPDSNYVIKEITADPFPDDRAEFVVAEGAQGVIGPESVGAVDSVNPNEGENIRTYPEKDTVIDFDNETPFKAITWLNQEYNLLTWPIGDGKLALGWPETVKEEDDTHLAAKDDHRIWQLKDPSIRHAREPLQTILVEGPWIDEPGYGWGDTIDEMDSWWDDDDNRGGEDVRAYGYAIRTGVENGTELVIGTSDAKKDALPDVAVTALKEEMKRQTSGSVEIDPHISGDHVSKVRDLRPGDFIQTIPQDEHYGSDVDANTGSIKSGIVGPQESCSQPVPNEPFLVTSVNFESDKNSNWTVNAELSHYRGMEIEKGIMYFNPDENEWLDQDQVDEDSDLKGDFWSFEDI